MISENNSKLNNIIVFGCLRSNDYLFLDMFVERQRQSTRQISERFTLLTQSRYCTFFRLWLIDKVHVLPEKTRE